MCINTWLLLDCKVLKDGVIIREKDAIKQIKSIIIYFVEHFCTEVTSTEGSGNIYSAIYLISGEYKKSAQLLNNSYVISFYLSTKIFYVKV